MSDLARLIAEMAKLAGTTPAGMQARLASMGPDELAATLDRLPAQMRGGLASLGVVKAVLGSTVVFNEKQRQALDLLNGPTKNVLLHGGARSSKTFNICVAIIERALKCPSRHVILRLHHSDITRSVGLDTMPKAISLAFPGLEYTLNRTDWIYTFSNGSEIMLAGLDTSTRMEKVLGLEFATIHLNEISQLTYSAMQFSRHRLAQRTELVNKIYADCNPPSRRHWGHQVFIEKRNPETGQPLPNPGDYAELRLNPVDNLANIADGFVDDMRASYGTRDQQRFVDGIWADDTQGSLFPAEVFDRYRIDETQAPVSYERIVLAVDPSGCSGAEDVRSDEIGIVMLGMVDGHAYVIADYSGRMGPLEWGERVVDLYTRHRVDAIVVETNFGAALATATIKAAAVNSGVMPRFVEVSASRAKHLRAEPVSALFEKGLVHLIGRFSDLEAQLGSFTTAGFAGDRSPDRADALVHGITELMPRILRQARRDGRPPRVLLSPGAARQIGGYGQPYAGGRPSPWYRRHHGGGDRGVAIWDLPPPQQPPPAPPPQDHAWPPGVTGRWNPETQKVELVGPDGKPYHAS